MKQENISTLSGRGGVAVAVEIGIAIAIEKG